MSNPALEFDHPEEPHSVPDRARYLRIAAWSFGAWATVLLVLVGIRNADETQHELRLIPDLSYDSRVDFAYFFAAANMVWHGDGDQLYPERYEYIFYPGAPAFLDTNDNEYVQHRMLTRGNYYNPPLVAILMSPLSSLSFRTAFWAFSLLSGVAFAGFLLALWRAGRQVPEMPLVVLSMAAFTPVHEAIIMGHLSLFFVLALGGGFLALRAKQPVLAGLVLSLLALKPQWAILPGLFLLWRRDWRALGTMAISSAALFFVPFLATGLESLKDYVQFLRDQSDVDLGNAPHMFSWNGFLSKLVENGPAALYVDDVSRPLLYSLQALTLAIVLFIWLGRDLYLGVAAAIIGMLLLSTHSVWYDWAFLVVPAAFLVLRPGSLSVRAQVWVLLLALFVSASQSTDAVFAPDGRHGLAHWSEAGFFSVTLVAFATLLWMAARVLVEGQVRLPQLSRRAAPASG